MTPRCAQVLSPSGAKPQRSRTRTDPSLPCKHLGVDLVDAERRERPARCRRDRIHRNTPASSFHRDPVPDRRAPLVALDVAERDRTEQLPLIGGDDGEQRGGATLAQRRGELQQCDRVGRAEGRRQVRPSLDLEVLTGVVHERHVSGLPRPQRHRPGRHLVETDGIGLRPLAHESPSASIRRLRVIVPVAPHTVSPPTSKKLTARSMSPTPQRSSR